jgi:membrane-bound lytic murein transglycosylase D
MSNNKTITGFYFLFFCLLFYSISFFPCQSQQDNYTHRDALDNHPDIFFEYCIEQLDKYTPVTLEYNEWVKEYIDIYTGKRKHEMEIILGKAQYYFPIFESYLDKYNLPLELKYITVIESGLNPQACSHSGAVGLWQFLLGTCKLLDLQVNSYMDERRDVYKSTEAACKYLDYLYRTFGDWQLVLAAYNGGPGEVRKAIERSGGKVNYWELRPYLSEQAKKYVPAFIAVNYIFSHYKDHSMSPERIPPVFSNADTVKIGYAVSFQQISKILDYPVDSIRILNPVYTKDYIPDTEEKNILILPASKIYDYLANETLILGYHQPVNDYHSIVAASNNIHHRSRVIHTVQEGEFFHKIAMQYNCTVENIKAWNHLDTLSVYPGQKLIIWISEND